MEPPLEALILRCHRLLFLFHLRSRVLPPPSLHVNPLLLQFFRGGLSLSLVGPPQFGQRRTQEHLEEFFEFVSSQAASVRQVELVDATLKEVLLWLCYVHGPAHAADKLMQLLGLEVIVAICVESREMLVAYARAHLRVVQQALDPRLGLERVRHCDGRVWKQSE